jgi:hypothetical protein
MKTNPFKSILTWACERAFYDYKPARCAPCQGRHLVGWYCRGCPYLFTHLNASGTHATGRPFSRRKNAR